MKHEKKRRKSWKIILLLVVILIVAAIAIYAGLYYHTLSKISLRNVAVDGLKELSLTGFTLTGHIDLANAGVLTINLDHIEYNVSLETGKILTTGYIQGAPLIPKQIASFRFENRINWVPTAELAKSLLTKNHTYLVLSGTVYVTEKSKVPFERVVTADEYVEQFLPKERKEQIQKVIEEIPISKEQVEKMTEAMTPEQLEQYIQRLPPSQQERVRQIIASEKTQQAIEQVSGIIKQFI